jgi:hypothetical protein
LHIQATFFQIVAAIIRLWKNTEQPLLPIKQYGLQREQPFLAQLSRDLDQMEPNFKSVGNILRQFERKLTDLEYFPELWSTIRNLKSQTTDIRLRVKHVENELEIVIGKIAIKVLRREQLRKQLWRQQNQP